MVVIDEEEFNDLQAQVENKIDPFTGQPAKFRMDKFYGKDMHLPNLTEKEAEEWFEWFEQALPGQFKRNELNFHYASNPTGSPMHIPDFFHDPSIQKCIEWGEQAESRMKEAETMQKKRRKDRLKLFDNCIKEYLNVECNANYKVKYDK